MKSILKHYFMLIVLVFACSNITVFYCYEVPIFNSLKSLQKYANLTDEYGPKGIMYPKESPSIKTRMARFLGNTDILWEPTGFKKILLSVIKMRSFNSPFCDFIEKTEPEPGTNFIIFGSIEGQFHFFVRCLQCLISLKILDEDLKLINPSYAIIFNGNSGINNHYDLEVLTVILQLMLKNQGKIFYIKNKSEEKKLWHKTDLMKHLKDKLQLYNLQFDEYVSLVDQFFNTLPQALYLVNSVDEKTIELVKCSNSAIELHEENLSEFFVSRESTIAALKLLTPQKTRVQVHVSAVINGDILEGLKPQAEPLEHHSLKGGVMQWSFGTLTHGASLMRDFFGVVTTAKKIDNWVIALFGSLANRPCAYIKAFNIFNGQLLKETLYQSRKKQLLYERLEFFDNEIVRALEQEDQSKLIKLEIELASLENRPVNPDLMKTMSNATSQIVTTSVEVNEEKNNE